MIVFDKKSAAGAAVLKELSSGEGFEDCSLFNIPRARYPFHDERLLTPLCIGRAGLLSVNNREPPAAVTVTVAAAVAVAEAIVELMPSCRRLVTVAGPLAPAPKNFSVPIGAPAGGVLEAAGVEMDKVGKIVFGGLMSGRAVQDAAIGTTKSISSVLPLARAATSVRRAATGVRSACIGCRECRRVCPLHLEPARLAAFAEKGEVDAMARWNLGACIECGCCAFVCPANIPLVHYLALGRRLLSKNGWGEAI